MDRGSLWYRVLVARYGEVRGRLEDGGRGGIGLGRAGLCKA